jgi:hypothetical protein
MRGVRIITVASGLALGFDTGLGASDFARSRAGTQVSSKGFLVHPSGALEIWQASGVIEMGAEATMVVWGAVPFKDGIEGKRLDEIVLNGDKDTALAALRNWALARQDLLNRVDLGEIPPSYPLGAWVGEEGVFFAPECFVKWSSEKEAWLEGAEQWTHPDLRAAALTSPQACAVSDCWTAAALLDAILSGEKPFQACDTESLHGDIREGVYTPLHLAAPGLEGETAAFLNRVLSQTNKAKAAAGPELHELEQILSDAKGGCRPYTDFFHALDDVEKAKIESEARQYEKRKRNVVKGRRFIIRNRIIFGGIAVALLLIAGVVYSIVEAQLSRPNTLGLEPEAVISLFFDGMNKLDGQTLDGCVTDKAGADYANAVNYFYVISKMREAYEQRDYFITPDEWIAAGAEASDETVFGVNDLRISPLDTDASDGLVSFRVSYTLYYPDMSGGFSDEQAQQAAELAKQGLAQSTLLTVPEMIPAIDVITLTYRKDRWLISSIEHQQGGV